jgi:uncharacterized protein (DUF3084 family)
MPNDIESTLQTILQEQAAMREQIKTIFNALQDQKQLTESVHTLAITVRDLANEQKNLSGTVSCVKKDVDELKEKPAKRWENLVSIVISIVVTALLTFALTKAGLK